MRNRLIVACFFCTTLTSVGLKKRKEILHTLYVQYNFFPPLGHRATTVIIKTDRDIAIHCTRDVCLDHLRRGKKCYKQILYFQVFGRQVFWISLIIKRDMAKSIHKKNIEGKKMNPFFPRRILIIMLNTFFLTLEIRFWFLI